MDDFVNFLWISLNLLIISQIFPQIHTFFVNFLLGYGWFGWIFPRMAELWMNFDGLWMNSGASFRGWLNYGWFGAGLFMNFGACFRGWLDFGWIMDEFWGMFPRMVGLWLNSGWIMDEFCCPRLRNRLFFRGNSDFGRWRGELFGLLASICPL